MSTPFYDLASLVLVPSGYKASKVYAQKPLTTDGQLTFSRASTATRVNSAGLIEAVSSNVPRLDYLGSTCPKLQLEPQRTNLALQSNDVTTSTTNVGYTATADNTTSPDGTANADRIMEDTSTLHLVQKEFSVGSTTDTYAVSFFVKANGRTSGRIVYGLNAAPFASVSAVFNLTAGTITAPDPASGATAGISKIENYGNGWYRISLTGVIGVAGTHYVRLQDTNGGVAGDPTKGFYVWGFQAELGAYPTSLINTTTAAVTRLADFAKKENIAGTLPTAYPFTLFGESEFYLGSDDFALSFIDISTFNTYFAMGTFVNKYIAVVRSSAGEIVATSSVNYTPGMVKIAAVFTSNSIKVFANGALVATAINTLAFTSTVNDIVIGTIREVADIGTRNSLKQALVFKSALTDAQAIEITTL